MNNVQCLVLCFCVFWCEALGNQTESAGRTIEEEDAPTTELDFFQTEGPRNQSRPLFTKWSPWSRCEDCLQRRLKKCVSPKCKRSKLYEERPCVKRRCQRKRRRKIDGDFRIVKIDAQMRKSSKGARPRIWSKWSKWSKCTKTCRTFRFRTCRKPGRCKKRRQRQAAYCYQDNTRCEHLVLNLLDTSNNIRRTDSDKYEYSSPEAGSFQQYTYRPKRCGKARRKTSMLKIIGGIEAKKYKWPWHVAVINRYREVFCAGTLIAPRWILTAGHCVRSYLRVRLNEHDLSAVDGRELEMGVQKIFLHPRFNYQTVDNDIALLRLPRSVKIPPVCLPASQPEPEELCSIMGWGKINSSDEYGTTKLQEAKVPVVSWETCTNAYKKYLLTTNMFCAGWASGAADTCGGDSGGGLMCPPRKGTKVKGYSIQGITSFGDGCGRKNKYGIYTMVYNYLEWIHYMIETYS